jgi:hypothetical protein
MTAREATAGPAVKEAGGKKDGRKGKGGGNSGGGGPDVRRLAADVDALRAEVAALTGVLRAGAASATPPAALVFSHGAVPAETDADVEEALARLRPTLRARAGGSGADAVALGYAAAHAEGGEGDALLDVPLAREVGPADDAAVARLASAFAAGPKAALARLLLASGDAPLSAAELGTGAGLTTGSLYHHLREMTHAGVLTAAGRSRYALTPHGRFAALALLALARHGG